ncbi:MAG: hypothetical protein JO261_00435 [Alphaproteobacteria bacterium]|nr:hypothetical protein [Alphaproteobacteria bacterium]MBV9692141.1 hypothetical protein [Alphaproteobacteria bacterium]
MAKRRKCTRCGRPAIAYLNEPDGRHIALCYDHVPVHDIDLAAPLALAEAMAEPERLTRRRLIPIRWLRSVFERES